jgi:hypothetical protein
VEAATALYNCRRASQQPLCVVGSLCHGQCKPCRHILKRYLPVCDLQTVCVMSHDGSSLYICPGLTMMAQHAYAAELVRSDSYKHQAASKQSTHPYQPPIPATAFSKCKGVEKHRLRLLRGSDQSALAGPLLGGGGSQGPPTHPTAAAAGQRLSRPTSRRLPRARPTCSCVRASVCLGATQLGSMQGGARGVKALHSHRPPPLLCCAHDISRVQQVQVPPDSTWLLLPLAARALSPSPPCWQLLLQGQ